MKNSIIQTTVLALVGLIIGVGVTHWKYQEKVHLYKVRLGETMQEIRRLEDEMADHHEHEAMADHAHMHHEQTALDDTDWRPTVALEVLPDAKAGWNIHLTTENFTFSPKRASTDHVEGEGHGHLFVDGIKLARLYGNWFHIDALEAGDHTVRVTLNGNDHNELAVDGTSIAAEAVITVQ